MARKEKSRVKRRRMGCLTGCLARLLTLLGLAALLFVASCVFGIVSNDPAGRPSLSLQDTPLADVGEWVKNAVPKEAPKGLRLPEWAYSLQAEGLTLKMLRAGKGEALLVCSDGYTMLVGGGSGKYGPALQMLLCGVNRLDAAVALSSAAEEISGLSLACQIGHPGYLFYQDTQTANTTYNALLKTAESMQRIVPHPGLSFTLGRAQVTFLGPVYTHHRDERDDGLSLRIDYGGTSFLSGRHYSRRGTGADRGKGSAGCRRSGLRSGRRGRGDMPGTDPRCYARDRAVFRGSVVAGQSKA